MSISSVSSTVSAVPAASLARAPDGDSAAVEKAESAATKATEKAGGGIAAQAPQPTTVGGVNKLV